MSPRADHVSTAEKRMKLNMLKSYVKKRKPTYRKLVAYGVLVMGWSTRTAKEAVKSLLDGEVMTVPRDSRGEPLPDGLVKIMDGEFYKEASEETEKRAKKLEAMK